MATAGSTEPPQTTAAVETAVRALSAPYGVAMVSGPAMITPAFLMDPARKLYISGNAVYRIDTDDALELIPASSFEVGGTARRWVYELDTIADIRALVIRRRADQDANAELLRGVLRRPVIHPEHNARDLLAAAAAKFDALADATDNLHERGFWARAQEQTARYAATLAYVRTLEDGIPQSWEHVHYTCPEVDQAEAVITWHGDLIRSYAVQAASEKVTRLANETITMLREKREKVVKEDGRIAARNVIARLGKGELRTDAALREQVLDVLVVHRHLIPTARRGHYMMVVPHD